MRFLFRAILGGLIFAAAVAVVILGVARLQAAMVASANAPQRPRFERAYAVPVAELAPTTARPVITAFGELRATRRLDLRAAAGGRIVHLSPDLREGAAIAKDTVLVRIDSTEGVSASNAAVSRRADAESELAEARQAAVLAQAELSAAETQRDIQREARDRRRALFRQGFATRDSLDSAELSLQSAEQTAVSRRQALTAARERVQRATQAVARAQLDVDSARRSVNETEIIAPFAGVLSGVDAALGRLATVNESLGELIDLSTLEVAFQVSEAQYARMLDDSGALAVLPLTVESQRGAIKIEAQGAVDRPAAETDGAGRVVYGRLESQAGAALRPGDFVTVRVQEPALENVAVLPSRALTEDGRLLLLGDDGRLEETKAAVLRRQGAEVIARDLPFGRRYVVERSPQLGPGVKARDAAEPAPERGRGRGGPGRGGGRGEGRGRGERQAGGGGESRPDRRGGPPPDGGGDMIALDDARRAALVAAVEGATRMPPERRERVLEMLSRPQVPRARIERLESRFGLNGGSGQ